MYAHRDDTSGQSFLHVLYGHHAVRAVAAPCACHLLYDHFLVGLEGQVLDGEVGSLRVFSQDDPYGHPVLFANGQGELLVEEELVYVSIP